MHTIRGHSNSMFVRRGRGGGSAKNEQFILNLKSFLSKKRIRGRGSRSCQIWANVLFEWPLMKFREIRGKCYPMTPGKQINLSIGEDSMSMGASPKSFQSSLFPSLSVWKAEKRQSNARNSNFAVRFGYLLWAYLPLLLYFLYLLYFEHIWQFLLYSPIFQHFLLYSPISQALSYRKVFFYLNLWLSKKDCLGEALLKSFRCQKSNIFWGFAQYPIWGLTAPLLKNKLNPTLLRLFGILSAFGLLQNHVCFQLLIWFGLYLN